MALDNWPRFGYTGFTGGRDGPFALCPSLPPLSTEPMAKFALQVACFSFLASVLLVHFICALPYLVLYVLWCLLVSIVLFLFSVPFLCGVTCGLTTQQSKTVGQ